MPPMRAISVSRTVVGSESVYGGKEKSSTSPVRTAPPHALRISRWERSLFSITYLVCRDNDLPPRVTWILTALEDLLWLSFAFNPRVFTSLPFGIAAVMEPVRAFMSYSDFAIVNFVALLLVFSTVSMVAAVGVLQHIQAKVPIPLLRIMRWNITLLLTTLSIPVASVLVGGLNCGSSGQLTEFGVLCTGGQHFPLLILNILGMLVYIPLLLIGALVFVETSPTSKSSISRTHGRVDVRVVTYRLVFVVLDAIARNGISTTLLWMQMAAITAGLAHQSWSYMTQLPYYDLKTNMFRAGMTAAATAAMLTSIVVLAISGGPANMAASGTGSAWLALLPATVGGYIVGAAGARWNSMRQVEKAIALWHGISKESAAGPPLIPKSGLLAPPVIIHSHSSSSVPSEGSGVAADPGPTSSPFTSGSASRSQTSSPAAAEKFTAMCNRRRSESAVSANAPLLETPVAGSTGVVSSSSSSILSSRDRDHDRDRAVASVPQHQSARPHAPKPGSSAELLAAVRESPVPQITRVFTSPAHFENVVRFVRSNPAPRQTALGRELLDRGLVEFPDDPIVLLVVVAYFSTYYGPEGTRTADALMASLGSMPKAVPLDIKFFAFSRDRAARDMGAHVLDRAALDNLERDMRKHHLRALCMVRDAWELIRTSAKPQEVSEAVGKLAVHAAGARSAYAKLLERNPHDKNLLRSYAQFLTFVEADVSRATQILEDADAAEFNESQAAHPSSNRTPISASPISSTDGLAMTRGPPELFGSTGGDDVDDNLSSSPDIGDVDKSRTKPAGSGGKLAFSPGAFEAPTSAGKGGPMVGNVAASETSGTSMSKVHRQKLQLRAAVTERVVQPLYATSVMYTFLALTFAAMTLGFVICQRLFTATTSVMNDDFRSAQDARNDGLKIADSIRALVYANGIQSQPAFTSAQATIGSMIQELEGQIIPKVAACLANLTTPPPTFRMYTAHLLPNVTDYSVLTLSGLDTAKLVVLAGKLTLSYPYRALTPAVIATIPELRFVTDNLSVILQALKSLPETGIQSYLQLMISSEGSMIFNLVCTLLILAGMFFYVDRMILRKYFKHESEITRLLLSVPRSAASHLVTEVEEAIESFREVTEEESDTLAGLQSPAALLTRPDVVGKNRGGPQYRLRLFGTAALLITTGLTIGMYALTLRMINLSSSLVVMSDSANQRFYTSAIQLYTREFVSQDPAVSLSAIIKNTRGQLSDLTGLHQSLVADPNGLGLLLPVLTVYPRNCTNVRECKITENLAIGFTAQRWQVSP
ncbi:hypothetical protein BC828DRAFT_377095 [Blastocladiella britannica]|nr:hypothetical protein BC828DRAFT_377095 [Blastocladiella britannica]